MKKVWTVLVLALLCICLVVPALASGDTAVTTCTPSSTELKAGDELTVVVSLSDSVPVKSMGLELSFDASRFEVVSAQWTVSGALIADYDASKGKAALLYTAGTDLNGDIFEFTLKVKDDAQPGETVVGLSKAIVKDSSLKEYPCTAGTTTVTIVCAHSSKTEVPYKSPDCVLPGNNQYFVCDICGAFLKADGVTETTVEAETIPATGHNWKDATCTEPKTCRTCGATEGEALGHDWKDATCTEPKTCRTCGATEGEALGHDWKDATCTEPKTCRTCGETEGEALGHSFTNYVSDGNATCTEDGTKTAKCDRCDVTDTIADVGSATGHHHAEAWSKGEDGHWHECPDCGDRKDFGEHDYGTEGDACVICGYERTHVHRLTLVPAKEATCTEDGNTAYYTCSGCEDWFEDAFGLIVITDKSSVVISALGHDWKDATCTEPKTCRTCGETEGEALGHSFTNYVPDGNTTCTEDGTKTAKCDRCDETDTIADVGSATGHDWEEATCTEPKTCRTCGETEGEALGHSFTNYVSDGNATCTEDGTKTAKCDRCDVTDTIADVGSATGHHHAEVWSKGEDGHWHECPDCGDRKDFGEHDYGTEGDACVICGYERNHVHRLTLVPAKEATCTESGSKAYYTCSGCEDWFEDAFGLIAISDKSSVVISALGHDWKDATCTEPKTCKTCGETEGEALGHTESEWICDETSHWKECTVCKEVIEGSKAEHIDENEDEECDVCGYIPPEDYQIIEGADGKWTATAGGDLTFRADGDFSRFVGVEVDGAEVDPSNYTVASGSTIVTLKEDYIKTLRNGVHTVTVVFRNGSASASFEVAGLPTTPQTGDNSNIVLWFALLVISGVSMTALLISGKKKHYSGR